MLDRFVALVEEIEHLAGVELSAATKPFAALGLGGGVEIVLSGVCYEVLAALGIGEAEVGHLQPGIDKEARRSRLVEDTLIGCDSAGTVAFILGEICFFEAKEIVAGKLSCEAVLDSEGFGIATVVTQEKRQGRAALDAIDDTLCGALAEESSLNVGVG